MHPRRRLNDSFAILFLQNVMKLLIYQANLWKQHFTVGFLCIFWVSFSSLKWLFENAQISYILIWSDWKHKYYTRDVSASKYPEFDFCLRSAWFQGSSNRRNLWEYRFLKRDDHDYTWANKKCGNCFSHLRLPSQTTTDWVV